MGTWIEFVGNNRKKAIHARRSGFGGLAELSGSVAVSPGHTPRARPRRARCAAPRRARCAAPRRLRLGGACQPGRGSNVLSGMRRLSISAVIIVASLALAPAASAAHHPKSHGSSYGQYYIPPGNGAANEYVESIPTAGGSRPSRAVGGGTGSTGARPGGGSAGAPYSAATKSALLHQGADGARAAALASATAPASVRRKHHAKGANGSGSSGAGTPPAGGSGGGGTPSAGTSGGASPASSLALPHARRATSSSISAATKAARMSAMRSRRI